jgi:hypothetical protein
MELHIDGLGRQRQLVRQGTATVSGAASVDSNSQ